LQGSQQLFLQGFGQHDFSHPHLGGQHGLAQQAGSHPQPPVPSMRSKRSKLNPWVHRPAVTTNAPKNMFHFIEKRLLNVGTAGPRTSPTKASK
jgi:hypothetical protein